MVPFPALDAGASCQKHAVAVVRERRSAVAGRGCVGAVRRRRDAETVKRELVAWVRSRQGINTAVAMLIVQSAQGLELCCGSLLILSTDCRERHRNTISFAPRDLFVSPRSKSRWAKLGHIATRFLNGLKLMQDQSSAAAAGLV